MGSLRNNRKIVIVIFFITILAVSVIGVQFYLLSAGESQTYIDSSPYVGIAFCGNTSTEAKAIIDKTKTYTNLFVFDTARSELSRNKTAVYEICDYATANGLSIIINIGIDSVTEDDVTTWFWDEDAVEFKANWTERWGEKFLGMYYNDEVGGIQLDGAWRDFYEDFSEGLHMVGHPAIRALEIIGEKMKNYKDIEAFPENYDLEANFFVNLVLSDGDPGLAKLNRTGITTFTSDYGLYWWDYLGGYDVVLAEMGWNASITQQIAQIKGAARLQEKEWGAMITWKYDEVPFLDSADQIYMQMLASYQAGAKYIIIFNYAKDKEAINTAQAMIDEHFNALERFWNDINYKQFIDNSVPEAALVLPHNYGWGMRNPNDTIWGFWPTDDKTEQIAITMYQLLELYGTRLDIVFEDPAFPVTKVNYKSVYFWDQAI